MDIAERIASIFPDEAAIPADVAIATPTEQREYLLGGELRRWDGALTPILSPVYVRRGGELTQQVVGHAPAMDAETALSALRAALAAYDEGRGRWPTLSVAERIAAVDGFARRMAERRTEVVRLLMWEIAKSRDDAEKEFDRTVQYIRDTIGALKDVDRAASQFQIEEGIIAQVRRSPLGVVLCMGPFNYPLNETFTTLIPALIMGNVCVLKPPKHGVLLYGPLLEAFRDSFPPGVINTIYGEGEVIVPPLMESGEVDVLAFIGSSRVADLLKKKHPHPHKLRGVLGMGAKNAAIVLREADLDATVKECLAGALSYNGQRCTALKMLFIHRAIYAEFLERFAAEIGKLVCGMPWTPGVKITPLPVPGKSGYLRGLVDEAVAAGATLVNPGGGTYNRSFFYPALLADVNTKARAYHDEQFGPVVPTAPFDDVSEPLNWVYRSNYGQQVSVFGKDPATLAAMIDPLVNQVCRVNINSQCQRGPDSFPFAGRKGSAEGTLSVSDALRAFSIRSLVAARENDLNKGIITQIVRERRSNFLNNDFMF